MYYNRYMNNYFENKLTYNEISFYLGNKLTIDEREIHSYHEILFYIDGEAELLTKNGQRALKNNSLIVIPKETYHFIRLANCDKFTRLKINFPSSVLKKTPLTDVVSEMRIFENANENISHALKRLQHILEESTDKAGFYAYCAFLMLIAELDITDADEGMNFYTNNSLMSEVMEYISDNLSEDLSIKALAKKFHVSSSGITHLFKNEFGIPLHRYIIQKRLLYARKLIHSGSQPTKIYAEAGFRDYSSFYKTYCRFFNHPPSKEKNAQHK